ncbi:hypothetical protein EVAR_66650_1 [Eumeta japonica]|uniref:Uncharacterized protein n=1 Tax=Eumeta variegata TaxID=151549 RepID=A0A4C1ZPU2_EUMVA|nr:hypothetical protein EVAR_66650_1 [Eumeta japonica]
MCADQSRAITRRPSTPTHTSRGVALYGHNFLRPARCVRAARPDVASQSARDIAQRTRGNRASSECMFICASNKLLIRPKRSIDSIGGKAIHRDYSPAARRARHPRKSSSLSGRGRLLQNA